MKTEEDKRFSHILSDPKFRHIPVGTKKVKIDKKFRSMFKDKHFVTKYSVDKRGRPISHTTKEDLKRYYNVSSEESDSDEESKGDKETVIPEDDEETLGLNQKLKSDKEVTENVKSKLRNLKIDYARGESALFSESSSDDDESEEEVSDEDIEHEWGEMDADADTTEIATHRIAACNMDWDRIRACDLMVLFNSFVESSVKSVIIYPSEFGKQRMKEEEARGPIELVESTNNSDDEEDSKLEIEKLRKYQLNRLKYYYAVVEFDSAETADNVYKQCDGIEYESSAIKLDLRFIPDDMTFDDEPKEICEKVPDPSKYQPRFFTTTALQQAKVELTWDETDPDRTEFIQKLNSGQIDNIEDTDLKAFIASSSGEESEEDIKHQDDDSDDGKHTDTISKYRALLNDIQGEEKKKEEEEIHMEVVWDTNTEETSEKLVQENLKEKEEKTPFEQYIDKRKAKSKEKRERKKQSQKNEDSDSDSDIPDDVKNDPVFAEECNKPEHKKKSKKKLKHIDDSDKDEQNRGELELLVMSDDEIEKPFKKIQEKQEQKTKNKKKYKKKKVKQESDKDDFVAACDLGNDERFSALFNTPHFNIESSHPGYSKKCKGGLDVLITEQVKRRATNEDTDNKRQKFEEKKSPDLNYLIKSIKQKTNLR